MGVALFVHMTDVDPKLVLAFNHAAALGRDDKPNQAERAYARLLSLTSKDDAVVTEEFVATVRMRRAFCLMDLERYEEARVELERTRKLEAHLGESGRYELFFALGNTYGALGVLDAAFSAFVEAISVAEDMDDYIDRPAQCWGRMLRVAATHKAWSFLEAKAAIALNTARLRGMEELEALAIDMLAMSRRSARRGRQAHYS